MHQKIQPADCLNPQLKADPCSRHQCVGYFISSTYSRASSRTSRKMYLSVGTRQSTISYILGNVRCQKAWTLPQTRFLCHPLIQFSKILEVVCINSISLAFHQIPAAQLLPRWCRFTVEFRSEKVKLPRPLSLELWEHICKSNGYCNEHWNSNEFLTFSDKARLEAHFFPPVALLCSHSWVFFQLLVVSVFNKRHVAELNSEWQKYDRVCEGSSPHLPNLSEDTEAIQVIWSRHHRLPQTRHTALVQSSSSP